jgi:hypothetical protein
MVRLTNQTGLRELSAAGDSLHKRGGWVPSLLLVRPSLADYSSFP